MRATMKTKWLMAMMVLFIGTVSADGETIGQIKWADDVVSWTGNIQNHGGTVMTTETSWWLTGAPDADQNGNGYTFDTGDQDTVAGWREGWNSNIVIHFATALEDLTGNDLQVVAYGGGKCNASVWASTDDSTYVQVGSIGAGSPGTLVDHWFDFGGQIDGVHYVKFVREATGSGTGFFVDAVGGNTVPEPGSIALILSAIGMLGFRHWKGSLQM